MRAIFISVLSANRARVYFDPPGARSVASRLHEPIRIPIVGSARPRRDAPQCLGGAFLNPIQDGGATMISSKAVGAALLLVLSTLCRAQVPTPSHFESTGEDRQAIQTLLDSYARAVSTKDRALFETLLLNQAIPFSDVYSAIRGDGADGSTKHYDAFAQGVFAGAPFTQRFQDVQVLQDGPLAEVSLVFVNSSPGSTGWGWKTLLLLKTSAGWKIASEFFTGHGGAPAPG
jgi:hypothetical protein